MKIRYRHLFGHGTRGDNGVVLTNNNTAIIAYGASSQIEEMLLCILLFLPFTCVWDLIPFSAERVALWDSPLMHTPTTAELIKGASVKQVQENLPDTDAKCYHISLTSHLPLNVPIHISPLFRRWEMTSPVLMTTIPKQQHAGRRRPWERHKNNGNIVSRLNVPHAAWSCRVFCVCVWEGCVFVGEGGVSAILLHLSHKKTFIVAPGFCWLSSELNHCTKADRFK